MSLIPLLALLLALLPASDRLVFPSQTDEIVPLYTFEEGESSRWGVVNDGVMGGRSRGYFDIQDGVLTFSGTLVTRGGGFTSVRTRADLDLSAFDGLELRVRGSGRTFEVEIDDRTARWGRSVSRRAPFDTRGIWTTVRVPFSELESSVFGQSVRVRAVDLSSIRGIGIYLLDGKDGDFLVEIDSISAYRENN